jgi:hypothetical protein
VAGADVSFIFSCQVAGKQVDEFAFKPRADARPLAAGARGTVSVEGAINVVIQQMNCNMD